MGVVYRAFDPRIAREVALKTIRLADQTDAGEDQQVRERLIREAQSAGRLSHPGIVTIFDADEQNGLAYVAMELVEGQRLSEYLADGIPQADKLAFSVSLLKMAGSALDYASRAGVVHRDVKPANIIVSDGMFKLLDFGVARVSSSQLTRAGTVVGTPNYMSPEQVRGDAVDGRSDQFSLAVIVYELLTGLKPFAARRVPSTLYKIVHEAPAPIHVRLPGIPRGVEEVVLRALAKDPAGRFPSCTAFAEAFDRAVRGSSELWAQVDISLDADDVTRTTLVGTEEEVAEAVAPRTEQSTQETGTRTAELLPAPRPVRPMERDERALPPPAGEASARAGSPTGLPREPPRRASRWPALILGLLAFAIGLLTVLVVRYPGLVRDRQALVATLAEIEGGALALSRDVVALFQADPLSVPAAPASESGPASDSVSEATPAAAPPEADETAPGPLASANGTPSAFPVGGGQPAEAGPAAIPAPVRTPPAEATIFFDSNVEGVLVTVDGNRLWRCITPCKLAGIPVGEHDLLAHRSGYGLQRRMIVAPPGETQVEILMSRPEGTLVISSEPSAARVLVDGSDTGKTTPMDIALPPGRHLIRLERGSLAAEETITVRLGELTHIDVRLAPE